jgi:hypothetical protein
MELLIVTGLGLLLVGAALVIEHRRKRLYKQFVDARNRAGYRS